GQDIACRWPRVIEKLGNENTRLRSQFASARFWHQGDDSPLTHEQAIFAQVWLGTFISDVITSFQVKPNAIIGYSLGETAGLFATRTWTNRDLMLERMENSSLFKSDLAGKCDAVRNTWGLSGYVDVDWLVGVVNCPAETVEEHIARLPWIYRLITNTPNECVIGGHRIAVESLIKDLKCVFHPVETITTVHCEVASPVYDAYRELHLFPTTPPEDVSFYSCIKGGKYKVTTDSAADSIVNMAVKPFDFTQVINAAYEDNVRLFIEMGPGASCTRMIDRILGSKPHVSHAVCVKDRNGILSVLQTLAILKSHGIDLDLSSLYQDLPARQHRALPDKVITVKTGHGPLNIDIPFKPKVIEKPEEKKVSADIIPHPAVPMSAFSDSEVVEQMLETESAKALTHETFLRISNGINQSLSQALSLQMKLLESGSVEFQISNNVESDQDNQATLQDLFMDRQQCLEFATGSIAKVLGEQFTGIDDFPTRVRLPDEPLMLVDRILEVEGEPCSMTSGRVVTEHDIHPGAWYLDGNRIPTCIAVESGQADLFLSGFLGIDKITRGLAVYRLLDAEITFHGPLPASGKTIHYDIRIDHFFKQGDTHLFRFNFDGTVDGKPLLTMRNGCAGFFTQTELDAGKGIVQTALELQPQAGKQSEDWIDLVPMGTDTLNDKQVNALRAGDLVSAFGEAFNDLPINTPVTLPSGRMTLVHRVLDIEPGGGRFGMGTITGEADIHPDDWFLTCHFVDDMVMPGTLMYECCLHTLRIYLMRLGWVGEANEFVYEPIPGVTSKLKCRGQVIATTKKVQYEIIIKEIGYQSNGTPYVIADALMYADGRPVVQMTNMSSRLSGLTRKRLLEIWSQDQQPNITHPVLFDFESILAFATGKP
ncbi:MAG: type I polyketide synthase, partial [Gammaproteobacteria bacterium]|nr:type I polyketide synthase [Gammaproteobacteria bacterium]